MSKKEQDNDRPRIYVTPRGERYVKADELLRSVRGRAAVKKMAVFANKLNARKSVDHS